jgi:NTE family protein
LFAAGGPRIVVRRAEAARAARRRPAVIGELDGEAEMALDGKTIGLALSGGGYRATLFGLGSLWRLNDAGVLGKLDRITSVSGGSIVMGVLAHRWKELNFSDGRADNFAEVIARPVQAFCSKTIDIGAGLAGILVPFKSAGEFLVDRYEKDLFGAATLKGLPVAGDGTPKFVFYATNLQTGRSFRFRQDYVADYMLGVSAATDAPLAVAVAASSAFPPIFSPIILKTDPASWKDGSALPNVEKLRKRIVLADGGVYDNMGLESLFDNVEILLVSDAGAPFDVEEDPAQDNVLQLGRVRDILIDQTRALRKRWLITEFETGRLRGAYWGIGTAMSAYAPASCMVADSDVSEALQRVPTRLSAFDAELQGRLINWGYALCDVSLRARVKLPVAMATAWPAPDWAL